MLTRRLVCVTLGFAACGAQGLAEAPPTDDPAIISHLPKGQRALQVEPLKARGSSFLVVLSSEVLEQEEAPHLYINPRVTLLNRTRKGYRKLWVSPVLRRWMGEGYWLSEWSEVKLTVKDLNKDAVPEVIVSEVMHGASWAPSHLDIFKLQGNKPVKILGASSDFPAGIEDVDGDGRYEAIIGYAVGWTMAHAYQVYWKDIFTYRQGRYVLANEAYPQRFRQLEKELTDAKRLYPGDPEILECLGRIHEIFRRPKAALSAYLAASRAYTAYLKDARDHQAKQQVQRKLQQCQERIQKLRRRGRS